MNKTRPITFSFSFPFFLLVPLSQGLTIDIGNEVREQNSLLDQMGSGFESTRDMLQGSLARIGVMLDTSSGKHMCYMVLFVVFVVVFLYWMMTFKGQSGA
jgi:blocked-early-in-transport protein 1